MLVLTTKKYEIEEEIQVKNESDEVLLEYQMQITPNEMQKLKNILFDESYKISKIKNDDEIIERALKLQEEFENIVFKNEKENILSKCGEYKYNELVDMIYDFFMSIFIEKKTEQISTLNSNLQKITKK